MYFIFFFQAEDGIRDTSVTGVQTCALPIYTKKVNQEVQEKNTTIFLSDGQGGMAPSMQIQQREKRSADHTVEVQTSTLLPDGSGQWQARERKESTIKEVGKERTTQEQVLREGTDGKLAPVSRTLS